MTMLGRINVSAVGGVPTITYEYDLGSGWVTYDAVALPHMAGATISGFLVDGFNPTPYASLAFYDTEWVWVAAGGGSSVTDKGSDVTLALSYWNGDNYEAVPSAWDFGADTGESSANITETLVPVSTAAIPAAHLVNGSGSLGILYNQSEVGALDVSSPTVANGTLEVNGAPQPFTGGSADLTLSAGARAIALEGYSNASASVTIVAGQTATLDLSGAGRTTFEESGLAVGSTWKLTVGGIARTANGPTISFTLPNGTFSIAYPTIPGYVRDPGDPAQITVPAASVTTLRWSAFTFEVPFSETGLPAGIEWWVNLSGVLYDGTQSSFAVPVPNGSTPYTVGSAYEFVADPASGTIQVTDGAFTPVDVQFGYRPTYIAGTVSPASASLTIGGVAQALDGGAFNASVTPGNYTLVASAPGYVTLTVKALATAGNTTLEKLVLNETPAAGTGGGASLGGLSGPTLLIGLGIVAIAAVAAAGAILARRRRAG
jgi:hypothetical protein